MDEDLQALRAEWLAEPEQAHRSFEAALSAALDRHDYDAVQHLVEAVGLVPGRALGHWRDYAKGLVWLEVHHSPEQAIAVLQELRTQAASLPDGLLGRVLNSLGIAYELNEQWDRAAQCYQEGLVCYEAEGNVVRSAILSLNLAILRHKGQDFDLARTHAQRAIDLLDDEPDSTRRQVVLASACNQLGQVHCALDALPDAHHAFEQSLTQWTACDDVWGQGVACDNLAGVLLRQGALTDAEAYCLRGRALSQQAGNAYQVAQSAHTLAEIKRAAGADPETIQAALAETLALARAANNHHILTDVHLDLADMHDRLGQPAEAIRETRNAVETVESLRANILLLDDRACMTQSRVRAYEQMVSRLQRAGSARQHEDTFHFVEMAKSRALVEMLARQPLRRPELIPQGWLNRETTLRERLHELYRHPHMVQAATRGRTVDDNAIQSEVAALEVELAAVRDEIRTADPEYHSFQAVVPLHAQDVQARLPTDAVLIEYFTVADDIFAVVMTSAQCRVHPLRLRVQDLQRAFDVTHNQIGPLRQLMPNADGRLPYPWILDKLCQALIDPLGEDVWRAALVCIVPHGLLHYVPFHAFFRADGNGNRPSVRYFGGDASQPREIVYAPSATVLFDYCQRKTPSARQGCLALGFNGNVLRQSEAEAMAVAHVAGGRAHIGSQATRAALLHDAALYRYIHLACHGWFNPTWPTASSLLLADGTLDVSDVLRELKLDADLVSLSACQTGRNQVLLGDELIGMTRAFLYAGSPSVLASHWVVDDLYSRLFAEKFYAQLGSASTHRAAGAAHARALSETQVRLRSLTADELRQQLIVDGAGPTEADKLLGDLASMARASAGASEAAKGNARLLSHPFFWASFFLVGDRIVR